VAEPPKNLLLAPTPGQLEVLGPGQPGDSIRWAGQMRADFQQGTAQFERGVEARFSGSAVRCERLRLEFNEGQELRHVNAEGQVQLVSAGENAWRLSAAAAEAVFAPGSVLSQVIAKGGVEVEDARRSLQAQLLTLFFEAEPGKEQAVLSRARASGHVSVRYAGEGGLEASCEELLWDTATDRYRLSGRPARLRQGAISTGGDTIIIDRGSGKWTIPRGSRPASTEVREKQPQ